MHLSILIWHNSSFAPPENTPTDEKVTKEYGKIVYIHAYLAEYVGIIQALYSNIFHGNFFSIGGIQAMLQKLDLHIQAIKH